MKHNFTVREISKDEALEMVKKYHYSNTLPQLTKLCLGFFLGKELVGVITLGWGPSPNRTIQKIFPSLEACDYWEIGRMCMTDEMEKNSESQMLSQCIRWLKRNKKAIDVLYTWADGMKGKPGYVYQAANFMYCGESRGDEYVIDGVTIHPYQLRKTLKRYGYNLSKNSELTLEIQKKLNIKHYRGKLYSYIYFLCDKDEKKRLLEECVVPTDLEYPKDSDLVWTVHDLEHDKWIKCSKPEYITDTFGGE